MYHINPKIIVGSLQQIQMYTNLMFHRHKNNYDDVIKIDDEKDIESLMRIQQNFNDTFERILKCMKDEIPKTMIFFNDNTRDNITIIKNKFKDKPFICYLNVDHKCKEKFYSTVENTNTLFAYVYYYCLRWYDNKLTSVCTLFHNVGAGVKFESTSSNPIINKFLNKNVILKMNK